MKVVRSILVAILALLNTFLSIGAISLMSKEDHTGIIGFFIGIAIVSFLISLLRKAVPFVVPTIVEFFTSPLSFLRFLFGIILTVINKDELGIDLDDSRIEDDVPAYITTLFVYYSIADESERTVVGNFFVQLLIVLPMSFLLSAGVCGLFFGNQLKSLFGLNGTILETFGVFGVIFVAFLLLVILFALADIKTSDVQVYVPDRTFFSNSSKGSIYSRSGHYGVTRKAADDGWEAIYQSSDFVTTKGHMLIYVLVLAIFSPILVITQAIGTVMAFVAIFTRHVYSNTGEILLRDVPLKVLQAPLAVLCSFVFC